MDEWVARDAAGLLPVRYYALLLASARYCVPLDNEHPHLRVTTAEYPLLRVCTH